MTKTTTRSGTADFSAQYKHPNWQKKRLEILEHDNFTCQVCGSTQSTLHVHHSLYLKGAKVWWYSEDELITVCDDCHKVLHEIKDSMSIINATLTDNYRRPNMHTTKDALIVLAAMAAAEKTSCIGLLIEQIIVAWENR